MTCAVASWVAESAACFWASSMRLETSASRVARVTMRLIVPPRAVRFDSFRAGVAGRVELDGVLQQVHGFGRDAGGAGQGAAPVAGRTFVNSARTTVLAGHEAVVMVLVPKDGYRYGYRNSDFNAYCYCHRYRHGDSNRDRYSGALTDRDGTPYRSAVKGFTDGLRMELEAEGAPVSVTLVKPASLPRMAAS